MGGVAGPAPTILTSSAPLHLLRHPAIHGGMWRLCWLLIFPAFLVGCTATDEPHPNVSILKAKCVRWHESGGYSAAFERAAEPARAALESQLRRDPPGKQAVVFDIDETLLSNWPYLRQQQFVLRLDTFAKWIRTGKALPLAPTKEIYERAKAHAIPIFLVTGRPEFLRAATVRDLQEAGYSGWSGLHMKPTHDADPSIIPFKSGVRRMLTENGYDIILNVGDQKSDLAGGYARRAVKLPNPFYFIP